ncbi:MAG: ANTAR domain-containing protein [Gammaproteobacteria bacterium]
MIVDEKPERAALLEDALRDIGYEVVARMTANEHLYAQVLEIQPDVIVIDMDSPDRDTLEHLCCVSRESQRPVVMFTHDDDNEKIRTAMRAGVSAYVVNGLSSERIRPVIEVAIARFQEFQALREDLAKANNALAERKVIERAKGLIMHKRLCSEQEAYQALRKLAMESNQRLAKVAESLVTAAELLM